MLLIGIAPTVSRVLAVDPMAGMAMAQNCARHAAPLVPAKPHAPAAPMDCCGYCCLLHHTPLLLGEAIPALAPAPPPQGLAVALRPPRRAQLSPLSAEPRGPPTQRV